MQVFTLLNDTLLKMTWLYELFRLLVERVFGLSLATRIGNSVHFFLYDTVKILLLLSVLIFAVSYVQSYFPPEKTKRILAHFKGLRGNFMGSLLGVLTPFWSCSSIPLFIGFTEAGLPLGVTFSFLITSPLSDMAAFLVLASSFGYRVAIAYMVLGVVLGMVGGAIIQALKMEPYVEDYVWQIHSQQLAIPEMTARERLDFCKAQVVEITQRVWKFVLLGVGVGALVHNWIPQQWVETVLGGNSFVAPLIATVIGAPMYGDIFGTIPIAEALFAKGIGVGTVLAFMMAVTALSVPSVILLRKVVKPRLLWTFVMVTSIGILIIGYLFNAIGYLMV